jgi:hypothetical protein
VACNWCVDVHTAWSSGPYLRVQYAGGVGCVLRAASVHEIALVVWGGRLMVGQLPVRQKIRVRFLALPPREVGSRVSRKSSVRQAVCHSEYRGMNPLNTRCNNLQPLQLVST